jgi:hypothetical protein
MSDLLPAPSQQFVKSKNPLFYKGFSEHSATHQCDESPHRKKQCRPPIKSHHAQKHDEWQNDQRCKHNSKECRKEVHSPNHLSTALANSANDGRSLLPKSPNDITSNTFPSTPRMWTMCDPFQSNVFPVSLSMMQRRCISFLSRRCILQSYHGSLTAEACHT